MKILVQYTLFTCFLGALHLAIKQCKQEGPQYYINRLFATLCLFSATWSFGDLCIKISTDSDTAHIFHAVTLIGIFSVPAIYQMIICSLAGLGKKRNTYIMFVLFLGYVLCFIMTQEGQTNYQMTSIGMVFETNSVLLSLIYTGYLCIASFNILATLIYMLHTNRRMSMRKTARKLLCVEMVVLSGMLIDRICEHFSGILLPCSAMTQFIGLLLMYDTICFINRSQVTIEYMSAYIYSALSEPVLVYDYDHNLRILNGAAEAFFNIHLENIAQNFIESLFDVQDESSVFDFEGRRFSIDLKCRYNQLLCNLSISKINDDYQDVLGYIIVVTNLSERVEAMEQLKMAKREAENANQAKTTFLTHMSHEIRTPMNAIIGFSELALKQKINSEVREYINGIHLASHNLLAIINDILDITKIESGKMEIIPDNYYLADLLDDVILIVSQQAEKKGLEFVSKLECKLPTELVGDKIRLRGVLINILNNAVKYTKKGTVSLEVNIISRTENSAKFAFVVKDTGIGIRPEQKDKLFQSFERIDLKMHYGIEGSGLGLAIAKGYVTLMGGEIKVDSVYGEGSAFTIIVDQEVVDDTPLQRRMIYKNEKSADKVSYELRVHDIHVLLVDDNQVNLIVEKGLLNSYGLTVDVVSDGKAAIEACRKIHYPIVFMDQMMPEMDGIEAMRHIRKLDPYYAVGGEGKIIVLTADAVRGSRDKLVKDGFDEYLGKPLNLKQLERLLSFFIPAENLEMKVCSSNEEKDTADEPGIKYLTEKLVDVDVAVGLENSGGKLADYLNVLKINYTYGEKHLEELEDLLQSGDYKNYTIKIHSVKSTSRGIGAAYISDMARKQEEAGRGGEYDYIDAHFEEFRKEYKKHLKNLEEVLRYFHVHEEAAAGDEEMNDEIIFNILTNIKNRIDAFEFAQVFEVLENIKYYQLPEKYQKIFQRLEVLMEDLAVEDIQSLLSDVLKK